VLRVGYFPNVTHAQGVIGSETTREKQGWFEQRLGPDVTIQWFPFNAGPSAMEAIFAGSIDLTYVGPSPAINAFIRSRGDEIRVLAGGRGGAALVSRATGRSRSPAISRLESRHATTRQHTGRGRARVVEKTGLQNHAHRR